MKNIYSRFQPYFPVTFFVGGFLFDLVTTDRIDQALSLVQQALYLFLIMLFLYWEIVTPQLFFNEKNYMSKVWKWHVEVLHFLFGSLLSLYTIFYFKSASLMTSFFFMIFLSIILVINELPQFHKKGVMVRSALFALCLSSYFIYLVPVWTHNIGRLSFVLAMIISTGLFLLLSTRVQRKKQDKKWLQKNILIPGLVVQVCFVLLYFFKVLPPVPISLKYIGVYHNIQKQNENYILSFERPWWKFWQSGAQTFIKREGDAVYCFVSVFSPTSFEEQLSLLWLKKENSGWIQRDQIPIAIRGGRAEGFRGYALKSNYEKGDWQVRVMTSDNREVGRISFTVVSANDNSIRSWQQDTY